MTFAGSIRWDNNWLTKTVKNRYLQIKTLFFLLLVLLHHAPVGHHAHLLDILALG